MRPPTVPHPVRISLQFCCLVLALFCCLVLASFFCQAAADDFCYAAPADSAYKDWYFTPEGVFGRTPIADVRYRNYVKVERVDPASVTVRKFNPAGRLVESYRVTFTGGKISLIAESNEWGQAVDSMWFTPDGKDEFIVRDEHEGRNPFLPCRAVRFTYKNGLLREILCLADSTKPGTNQEGVAHYVFDRFDDPQRFGLLKSESFFNEIDMPVYSRKEGCHRVDFEYDKKENLVSRRAFDEKDKPMTDPIGAFRTTYKYDGDDNETGIDYFDANGKPVTTNLGYARLSRDFKRGFPETETHFDHNNYAVLTSSLADSVATIQYRYDKAGHLTEKAFFNPNGEAMNNKNGISRLTFEYSAAGMLTGGKEYGLTGDFQQEHELASLRFGRDEKGRLTSLATSRSLARASGIIANGTQFTRYGYDAWSRVYSTSYWLEDSLKTNCPDGYHESRDRYDGNGQIAEQDYYNAAGQLTPNVQGYSRIQLTYNEQGLLAGRRYFDGDRPVTLKRPVSFFSNFHEIRYAYDLLNRLRTIEYFDGSERPVNAFLAGGDGKIFHAQRVEINYAGGRVIGEILHDSGDVASSVLLDCASNQCVPVPGYTPPRRIAVATIDQHHYHGNIRIDSLFGDQVSFISRDSVLLFLGSGAVSLSPIACAELYRVVRINQYYQQEGLAIDRYLENDSIAARLSYTQGRLNGPCVYYYPNGTIKEKGEYSANTRTGIWDYYYDNGQPAKTIDFTGKTPLLVQCYAADGKLLAQQGNGLFEGIVTTGTIRSRTQYTMTGPVRNGLQNGDWKIYNRFVSGPANIETFSAGVFKKGVSFSYTGKRDYRQDPLCRFESIHSEEGLDHYGQNNVCLANGLAMERHTGGDWFAALDTGFYEIMRTNEFNHYTGWLFLDIKFDEDGGITSQYVRLWQPNYALKTAILNMMDRLEHHAQVTLNNKKTSYEKFFIVLMDQGQVVIPEQILAEQRSMFR